jgi:D-alanyl-D-alanine dipeptidase
MDRATIEPAIRISLTEIHSRLSEAARIAKAAEACALTGSVAEGVTVSMDIEQLIYEAGRLQDAASLLNRLSRE